MSNLGVGLGHCDMGSLRRPSLFDSCQSGTFNANQNGDIKSACIVTPLGFPVKWEIKTALVNCGIWRGHSCHNVGGG